MQILAYFVSDVHIEPFMRGKHAHHFLKWLQKIKREEKLTHLFLLGDICDLWVGEKKLFIEAYKQLIEALKALQKKGVEIHYFEGNRDFNLRAFWEKKLSFFVHKKARYFQLGSLKLRLEHGDEIFKQHFYSLWKWLIHTHFVQWIFSVLPEKWLLFFGQKIGLISRYRAKKKSLPLQKMRIQIKQHIEKCQKKTLFDLFISGHFHRRDDFIFTTSKAHKVRALNLGSWLKNSPFSVLRFTQNEQKFVNIVDCEKFSSEEPD